MPAPHRERLREPGLLKPRQPAPPEQGAKPGPGPARTDVSSDREGDAVSATQTRSRFLERLQNGPAIVADGGMGALLSAAVPRLRCPEEANLRAPDACVSLHVSLINASAELIWTTTCSANQP